MTAVIERDTARQGVYAAEDTLAFLLERGGMASLFGSILTMPVERRFSGVEDVRRYLVQVRKMPWGFADVVHAPTVRERRGQNAAHWSAVRGGEIAIPVKTRALLREMYVLHEYAHHVTWFVYRARGHGTRFQQVYVHLLEHAIGPEAGFILRANLP